MLSSSFFRKIVGYNAFPSDAAFKAAVATKMYELGDKFSAKYEKLGDDFIIDATDDYLSMDYNKIGILVSRQVPSHQIWVASPVSGSLKFDYDTESAKWVDHKNHSIELTSCLDTETDKSFEC